MTYILNAIALASEHSAPLRSGRLLAEPDSPALADLTIGGHRLKGAHFLIVTDDGSGYRNSHELSQIPETSNDSTVVSVPPELRADFRFILARIAAESPVRTIALFLESNRSLSRSDPTDPFPTSPSRIASKSLTDYLQEIENQRIQEDELYLVADP